jgi:hypothetical protein
MFEKILYKGPEPKRIPKSMQQRITILKKTKTQTACTKKAYGFLSTKYHGNRINTYLKLHELFQSDINTLWKKKGFLHCTNINYLLRILLIKSGHFADQDLQPTWTLTWFISPHQYLKVKLKNKKKIDIDLWAKIYGTPYGKYASGFN